MCYTITQNLYAAPQRGNNRHGQKGYQDEKALGRARELPGGRTLFKYLDAMGARGWTASPRLVQEDTGKMTNTLIAKSGSARKIFGGVIGSIIVQYLFKIFQTTDCFT